MKSIKIGKLIFSRKAILTITFGAFCFGFIYGALLFMSIKTESKFNMFLYFALNIPIWILLRPILKKEVTEIP